MPGTVVVQRILAGHAATSIGQRLFRASASFMGKLDRELHEDAEFRDVKLSATEYFVLSAMDQRAVNSQAELGKDVAYESGAMSRMIDRLEAKNLIRRQRCSKDRRTVKLELTEEGRALLPKLHRCAVGIVCSLLQDFTRMEASQLEEFLARLSSIE